MADTTVLGRVLILSTTVKAVELYVAAAEKLGVMSAVALESDAEGPCDLRLRFEQRESALEIVQYAIAHPLAAIVAADERTAPTCARAASMMGLRWHTPRSADACLDKFVLRQKLSAFGLAPVLGEPPPGRDVAVAAILDGGKLRVLGVLDEESHAVAPDPPASVRPASGGATKVKQPVQGVLRALPEIALRSAQAIGLTHGPVCVKLRIAGEQVSATDVALAIPADCDLRFKIPLVDADVSLAEVVLRHALGLDISRVCRR